MEQSPQPNILFFRTKRFWFRWAVPGLLLALWVEGMLFEQSTNFCFSTLSSEIDYSISMKDGNLSLRVFKEIFPSGFPGYHSGWPHLSSGIQWHPGLKLLQPFLADDQAVGCLGPGPLRIFNLPLWFPIMVWLIFAYLRARHHERKHAELRVRSLPLSPTSDPK